MATKLKNMKQHDQTSANTNQKMMFKPFHGIMMSFRMEVTSCIFKPYQNVHTGIYVMASEISADCK